MKLPNCQYWGLLFILLTGGCHLFTTQPPAVEREVRVAAFYRSASCSSALSRPAPLPPSIPAAGMRPPTVWPTTRGPNMAYPTIASQRRHVHVMDVQYHAGQGLLDVDLRLTPRAMQTAAAGAAGFFGGPLAGKLAAQMVPGILGYRFQAGRMVPDYFQSPGSAPVPLQPGSQVYQLASLWADYLWQQYLAQQYQLYSRQTQYLRLHLQN